VSYLKEMLWRESREGRDFLRRMIADLHLSPLSCLDSACAHAEMHCNKMISSTKLFYSFYLNNLSHRTQMIPRQT